MVDKIMDELKDSLIQACANVIREHLRQARTNHDVKTITDLMVNHDVLIRNMASACRDAMAEAAYNDAEKEVQQQTSLEFVSNDEMCFVCGGMKGKHSATCPAEAERKARG